MEAARATKPLGKIERTLRPRTPPTAPTEDPRAELKRLVRMHNALTKASIALHHMASDRVNRKTGETIACLLPADDRADLIAASERRSVSARSLKNVRCPDGKPGLKHELVRLEVYNRFLKDVFGLGSVVSAYLCAFVDIRKAEKPSQLIRYCGYACIDGKAERRWEGFSPKTGATGDPEARGTFNKDLKVRLWQAMNSMWKCAAPRGQRGEVTSKYLVRWRSEKARRLLLGESKKKAHDAGRRAATDLLLYDLYLIWRALEGLPCWTTWYDWARGYEHGRGPLPRENVPRMLSIEEALKLVGNVGPVPVQS